MQSSSPALRRAGALTVAALAILTLEHLYSLYLTAHRPLHFDEAQYLHAGWLMERGLRLYRDFSDDHSPFLFVLLERVVPASQAGERLDLLAFHTEPPDH